jgi:diguanylate cyclase (GGDEF)-like protein
MIGDLMLQSVGADFAWRTTDEVEVAQTWQSSTSEGELPADETLLRLRREFNEANHAATGLVAIGDRVAIAARSPIDGDEGQDGFVWCVRVLDADLLEQISTALGTGVVFVASPELPKGSSGEQGGALVFWPTGPDEEQLAVAWRVEDVNGDPIGSMRANVSVLHISRQAETARRIALIILSLSIGLVVLMIVGMHILVTGPVVRLLQRLSRMDDTDDELGIELTTNLHGEPLMLARRLESAFDRLAHISKTDQLTGLANRRHFEEVRDCFYHQARRYNRPLSMLVLDIDFFKAVNDAGGHSAGDELLKGIADCIERACRRADLPARIGGDEFAVLMPETAAPDAEGVAARISEHVMAERLSAGKLELEVTLSIGVADLNAAEIDSPEAMTIIADKALYAAKERGRNCIVQAHDLDVDGNVALRQEENGNIGALHKKLAGLDNRFKGLFVKAVEEIMEIIEQRDPHMANHARKVQHYATLIAHEMELPDRVLTRLQVAAMLHDIGMVAVPDSVLLNPGALSDDQRRIMRRHTLLSVRVMEGMEFLEQEIPAVRYHHERYDGKGYPEGLSGPAIPLTARILAVADAFDAMTSPRSFRQALDRNAAIEEIKRGSGQQFDPVVVDALVAAAIRLGDKLMDFEASQECTLSSSMQAAWRESEAAFAEAPKGSCKSAAAPLE